MDDKGYAFTPLALLLIVPVVIIAISYNGIVDDLNTISVIALGGDVTNTIATNIVKSIEQDTQDAGRRAAFLAVQTVIDNFNLQKGNYPFFGNTSGNNSTTFIVNNVVDILNTNLTNTCRSLEIQTGREITIDGYNIDSNGTDAAPIFTNSDVNITQTDPFGMNIVVASIPIKVVQNSTQSNQSTQFNTPQITVYVSIDRMEDPYIWVNTKARNSTIVNKYTYYTSAGSFGSTTGDYHFADNVSAGKLNYLYECLVGPNGTMQYGTSYYFPDPHGLSFFDRLENRTNNTSGSPPAARMSAFILYDPTSEDHGSNPTSCLDHEYFAGVNGSTITAKGSTVLMPWSNSKPFLLSTNYKTYLGLSSTYT